MRRYDANPALSAFTAVVGAVLGIVAGVVLGFSAFGIVVLAVAGIAAAGLIASSLGVVGERAPERHDDLPSHYDDY